MSDFIETANGIVKVTPDGRNFSEGFFPGAEGVVFEVEDGKVVPNPVYAACHMGNSMYASVRKRDELRQGSLEADAYRHDVVKGMETGDFSSLGEGITYRPEDQSEHTSVRAALARKHVREEIGWVE